MDPDHSKSVFDECTDESETPVPEAEISIPTFSSSINEPIVMDTTESEVIQTCNTNIKTTFDTTSSNISEIHKPENGNEADDEKSKTVGPVEPETSGPNPDVCFNLATTDLERSEKASEQSSSNYVSEFHKFLQQETAAKGDDGDTTSIQDVEEKRNDKTSADDKTSKTFVPSLEDTSNSSWYKFKEDEKTEKTLAPAICLPPDETSNLSMGDNASCVSSNLEYGMSFQDQNSNLDECSNLSMPDEASVQPYGGHQPVFDESANMNPPSNMPCTRPDTPNSEKDREKTSDSTPAKKFRRGTLQIAADDASEHGQ